MTRRVGPALGMRLLAVGIASLFIAVFATSATLGLGMLAHHPFGDSLLGWCRDALSHGETPLWASGLLSVLALWCTARLLYVARDWYRHRGVGASRVHVLETPDLVAFAQTGRHGGIVVSTGMLEVLDDTERTVLFAHEQAHLDQRHDRYLAIAALGASVPPLLPAAEALRHAIERCADECAANAVGDRSVVARALTKVALTRHDRAALTASIAGSDIVARVEALVAPTPRQTTATVSVMAVTALSVIVGSAVVQMHHSVEVLLSFCPW